jgi:hypothetical protein
MLARVTVFEGAPDVVDGPICFPVKRASEGEVELPGFLGLFDVGDRKSGHAVIVTLGDEGSARCKCGLRAESRQARG